MKKLTVTLYSRDKCPLCTEAETLLKEMKEQFPFHLRVINIYNDERLLEKYHLMIPVVCIGNEEIDYGNIEKEKVIAAMKERLS